MYKLGYYDGNGEMITLRHCSTKEEAKKDYKSLKKQWNCTIWILKIEKIDPKTL